MSDDERHEHNFEQVSRYSLGCCLCTIVLFSVWPFFRLGLWHRAFAEIIGKQVRKTTSRRETKTCICGWSRKRVDLSLWRFLQTRWEMLLLRLVLHPSLLPASSCFARILEYHFARLFWLACFPIFLLPQRTISPTFYFATLPSLPTPRSRRSPLVLFLSFFTSPPTSPISLNFPFPPSSKLSPLD